MYSLSLASLDSSLREGALGYCKTNAPCDHVRTYQASLSEGGDREAVEGASPPSVHFAGLGIYWKGINIL